MSRRNIDWMLWLAMLKRFACALLCPYAYEHFGLGGLVDIVLVALPITLPDE